jgi:hypothetical protein
MSYSARIHMVYKTIRITLVAKRKVTMMALSLAVVHWQPLTGSGQCNK